MTALDTFACAVRCPPGRPYVAVPCGTSATAPRRYDRVGASAVTGRACNPVGAAVY